jgi:hypothetical protein
VVPQFYGQKQYPDGFPQKRLGAKEVFNNGELLSVTTKQGKTDLI